MHVLVYCQQITPRLKYVLYELFQRHCRLQLSMTTNETDLKHHTGPKICYAQTCTSGDTLHIIPHGLVYEKGLKQHIIEPSKNEHWHTVFFHTPGEVPFDVFSAAFYLLSRYEEYAPYTPDTHGRFPFEVSVAYHSGFLHVALIDRWRMRLLSLLGIDTAYHSQFRYTPTIDVDTAYLFRGIGIHSHFRKLLGSIANGSFLTLWKQLISLINKEQDPYDTYHFIEKLAASYGAKLTYFILCHNGSIYDKQCNPQHITFHKLLNSLSQHANIGLHPSYKTMHETDLLLNEKKRLENWIKQPITCSRQHYIRFSLPLLYQQLHDAGISDDYSMGYANHVGFRASTSLPFGAYNLHTDSALHIVLHPFVVMDTTLRYAMKLHTTDAITTCRDLIDEVVRVKGQFISIWHNSNLSEVHGWNKWQTIYQFLHEYAYAHTVPQA